MTSPVDPNEIRLTGENSYIRLHHEDDGPMTTFASHWRILFSPAGPGNVLFLKSEIYDDQVKIYADNIALVRWLQEEIVVFEFPDQSVPVEEAEFSRHGDVRSFSTEKVAARDMDISLTWYDLMEPFAVKLAPGEVPNREQGIYSVLIPARRAQLLINGTPVPGRSIPRNTFGLDAYSCALAWSESWVRPR